MNRKQRRAEEKQGKPAVSAPPINLQQLFADAIQHRRAGRSNDAQALFRQILAIDPKHADSLHMLGVMAFETGRLDLAIDLIGHAIEINPQAVPYHSNLGNALQVQKRLDEAIASYRRAIDLKPDLAEAHNNLGVALKDQGKLDEAAASYRRAIDLKPDYPDALYNLGDVLRGWDQLDEAIVYYRGAIDLRPHYWEAHNNLGNALRDHGLLDEAIACYRRTLELKPDFAEAHTNLGGALQERGRFEEAIAAHREALRLQVNPCQSYYGLSNSRKFIPADRPLIADIQTSLENPDFSDSGKAALHFALGKIFDDLAEYETALRHIDEANRLERAERRFDGSPLTALVDWLIAAFPKETTREFATSDSELPILVVGMPRSGTTLTEQILASHPEIAAGGELKYWLQRFDRLRSRLVGERDPAAEHDAIDDYLTRLQGVAPGAQRVTDKMPFNFLILGLVHRLFPNARIIHCRRHPIDTALSIYFARFTQVHDFANSREGIVLYYRAYRRLMQHWRTMLPPDRFIEVDYEEMTAEQELVSRRLIAFCGLEWDPTCLEFHRTDRPIRTASAWQARQPIYRTSTERWRRYEPWLGEFRGLLP